MDVETEMKSMGVQALQDLLSNLTGAKAFVLEQAPEFCQQLATRGMVLPLFAAAALTVAALLMGCVFMLCVHWFRQGKLIEDGAFFGIGLSAIATVVLLVAVAANLYKALAVYVAPKVFLVEEITRMVR